MKKNYNNIFQSNMIWWNAMIFLFFSISNQFQEQHIWQYEPNLISDRSKWD